MKPFSALFEDRGQSRFCFSLSAEQVAHVRGPAATPVKLPTEPVRPEFLGRPCRLWRSDPDIARHVNDHFARAAGV